MLISKRALGASAVVVVLALLPVIRLPGARAADTGLQLVASQQLSSRLVELTFRTDALTSDTRVRILLPDGYDPSGHTRYPVLYLLHGAFDDYRAWTDKGGAAASTAGLPLIVVMPDGGSEGNYTNWYNFGAGGPPRWETYHIDQLVPWIDTHLPTIAARRGRAVAGLSMGGNGALAYAALHPDLFSAAASFSGAVDTNNEEEQVVTGLGGLPDGRPPGAIFGLRATDEVRWRGHNPWDLAANLGGMLVELDVGNGAPGGPDGNGFDPVEESVHEQSVAVHDQLLALGVTHVWDDYGPGAHNFYYWSRDLRQFLPRLMDEFAHPVAPTRVTYRTIQPGFSEFGWQASVQRPALEFAELSGADSSGFTLRGSGTATVVTPPVYRPGSTVTATVADEQGTHAVVVAVGSDRRVRLDLTIGPANPYQAYTAEARTYALTSAFDKGLGYSIDRATGNGTLVYTVRVSLAVTR